MSRSGIDPPSLDRTKARRMLPAGIAVVLVQVMVQTMVSACTGGVLPAGLKERGSSRSIEYVAEELLPNQGLDIALLGPRLGDPTLLSPDATGLTVTFYVADPTDATAIDILITADPIPQYPDIIGPAPADAEVLSASAAPVCQADGICRLTVGLPTDLPGNQPMGLCVRRGSDASCSPGAFQLFDAVPDPLRIAVLSDLHLGKRGVDKRIDPLFDAIDDEDSLPDIIAITGDLTDQGQPDLLTRIMRRAAQARQPVIVLPGNHDFKHGHIDDYLLQVTPRLDHAHVLGPYLLLTLNTGPGRWDQDRLGSNSKGLGIEANQLAWVGEVFTNHPEAPARILFLHHPPFSTMGSVFIHRRKALVSLCKAEGVSLMVAGHTHMLEVVDYHGFTQGLDPWADDHPPSNRMPLTLVSARSTDRTHGGFRLITLQSDGSVSYRWRRIRLP